jgi:adenosylhomocysteine nucleosidase
MSDLLIVCGMQLEANLLGSPPNATVLIGAGDAAVLASGIETEIARGAKRVLSFGTAGGLAPSMDYAAGDIFIGCWAKYDSQRFLCDPDWRDSLLEALEHDGLPPLANPPAAVVTCSPTTVSTAAAKVALRASTGADAVDMESFIAAKAAAAHGLPFAILRAITDPADFTLPPAAADALTSAGGINILGVLESLRSNPAQFPELAQLGGYSTLAFNNLAKALAILGENFGWPDAAEP